ncbi:MAG: hypothetical protein RL173_916 [Fibrobacterota bacterium]|jgi:hypothetical protein
MRKTNTLAAMAALVGLGLSGCLQPIPNQSGDANATKSTAGRVTGVAEKAYPAYTFFDEDFQQGGFTFVYGGSTKLTQIEGDGAEKSEYYLHLNLDQRDYSGGAVCLWNMQFDMTPYLATGALVFQAKSKSGGEKVFIGLGDDEKSDGWKAVVRVPLDKYGTLKKGEWTTYVIPLRDFGKRGVAWDATKGIEIPWPFQWDNVQEFRVLSNKGDNPDCEIDIDNIQVYADAVGSSNEVPQEDWLDLDKNSDGPNPANMKLDDEIAGTFFENEVPAGGFAYGYGGKTTNKILECTTPGNSNVWALYFDNDWSGVNMSIGNKYIDVTPFRKTGSLTFWIKAGPSAKKFMVGLMDNQGNDKKVQTKVMADGYAVLKEGEWVQVRVPLKAFIDDGVYWDAKAAREISSKMDWTKIQEVRISIGKDENKPGAGKPVIFYVDQVQLTRTSKGIFDPDAYWDAFKSDASDLLVSDFTKSSDKWETGHGASADISASVVALPKGAPAVVKGQALKVDFKPGDWYDAYIKMENAAGMPSDWSKHYAISLWLYTDKPYQSLDFTIQDKGKEFFITKVGEGRGWHQILVPFRSLNKFPYYQPPDAVQNNLLDLDGIFQFGLKPGGEIPGTLYLANIQLTNLRQIQKIKGPASLPAIFKGNASKSIQKVPDVYGINVGLWAPELMDDASVELQKPMNLGVVRYPGGLRSDEEDWEKTLRDKDFNVDTDEFLDWCGKVNCKPMFTANIGDGSPERAAKWVEYVNKKRSGPAVMHWELGNEVYGNWHKYYEQWGKDGGVAYAKMCRKYIEAMKAVDPTIKITVVWMLGGAWNKTTFEELADVVDGVNVHHYAQATGSESDPGLLAVSQESDVLMKDVRHQVEKYGVKGKKYEIWLTEWNSVDFNPGPQILQHVNALFVADYLGHLAQAPIEIANLWALYNGRDKRMGDYGVLAASADPQGLNARRPTYWAMRLMANALNGTLVEGSSNQEPLQSWMSKRADGKMSIVFVNKNPDTEYKTTLKVPGLKGEAIVEVLTAENSGGLKSNEATGEVYSQDGPKPETKSLADGSVITVPKYSIVTIRFQ